jgi:MFS-type transporter involved in bile tolerance (Atg22 family)
MEYRSVIALALCSILIGSVLGMRFRFIILLPIIAVGSAGLAAISIAQGGTLAQTALVIVVFASLLQFGYICAAVFKNATMPAYAKERTAALGSPKLRS